MCPDFFSEASTEDYYDGVYFTLCNEGAASPFGKVFLPTLYSLVFIVGFAGVSFCKRVPLIYQKVEKATVFLIGVYEHNVIVLTSVT